MAYYKVKSHPGVAFQSVIDTTNEECWNCWADPSCEFCGGVGLLEREVRRYMMVGDDHLWELGDDEVEEINLEEEDFCLECGQIGCVHYSAAMVLGFDDRLG